MSGVTSGAAGEAVRRAAWPAYPFQLDSYGEWEPSEQWLLALGRTRRGRQESSSVWRRRIRHTRWPVRSAASENVCGGRLHTTHIDNAPRELVHFYQPRCKFWNMFEGILNPIQLGITQAMIVKHGALRKRNLRRSVLEQTVEHVAQTGLPVEKCAPPRQKFVGRLTKSIRSKSTRHGLDSRRGQRSDGMVGRQRPPECMEQELHRRTQSRALFELWTPLQTSAAACRQRLLRPTRTSSSSSLPRSIRPHQVCAGILRLQRRRPTSERVTTAVTGQGRGLRRISMLGITWTRSIAWSCVCILPALRASVAGLSASPAVWAVEHGASRGPWPWTL